MSVTRPILRYHGGKWKLAPWVIANMPPHRVYVEPFGGGGSVLLRKERAYAEVYNDLDGDVVGFFKVLRDPVAAMRLHRALVLTPFAREEYLEAWEPSADAVEQARRMVIRSFMGFGSAAVTKARAPKTTTRGGLPTTGFRANSNRLGTTPAHDWVGWPKQVPQVTARLMGVVIENRDASEVMAAHDGLETLHFVDPPYVSATRDAGSDYKHEMDDADHRELAGVLRGLKGMVMLSGYPSALYDELYGDWNRLERAALADGAKKRTEVLWFNPAAWNARPQMELMEREVCS